MNEEPTWQQREECVLLDPYKSTLDGDFTAADLRDIADRMDVLKAKNEPRAGDDYN